MICRLWAPVHVHRMMSAGGMSTDERLFVRAAGGVYSQIEGAVNTKVDRPDNLFCMLMYRLLCKAWYFSGVAWPKSWTALALMHTSLADSLSLTLINDLIRLLAVFTPASAARDESTKTRKLEA